MENNFEIVFVLQGLNDSLTNRQIYFAFALMSYLFTVSVNLTLIITISLDKTLHEPIYIFLCSLCFNEICGASSFYPKLLHDLLTNSYVITYTACLGQMFVTYSYIFSEFTSLTVMAYDRYIAICKPLQYRMLMTAQKVAQLLMLTWCFSVFETAVGTVLTARLPLCGRHIPKIFCTNWEVGQTVMLWLDPQQYLCVHVDIFTPVTDCTNHGVVRPPDTSCHQISSRPQEIHADVSATPHYTAGLHHLTDVWYHVLSLQRRQCNEGPAECISCSVPGGPTPRQSHHLWLEPAADQVQDGPQVHPPDWDIQEKLSHVNEIKHEENIGRWSYFLIFCSSQPKYVDRIQLKLIKSNPKMSLLVLSTLS